MIIRRWQDFLPYFNDLNDLDKSCFYKSFWRESIWNGLFDNRNSTIILEFEQTFVVGQLMVMLIPPEAELLRIGVSERFRRKGIGNELIRRMVEDLESNRIKEVFLEVREDNLSAIDFYQSNGFAKTGIRKDYYRNPPCSTVLFIRFF